MKQEGQTTPKKLCFFDALNTENDDLKPYGVINDMFFLFNLI